MVIDRSHAVLKSCALVGIDAELVDVECTITRGLPQYNVVGLPAPSVKEGATRIQNALLTVGHNMSLKKVTVNLAPADLRKSGSSLDLPIALAVLVAEGVIAGDALAGLVVVGYPRYPVAAWSNKSLDVCGCMEYRVRLILSAAVGFDA